jgi:hypothetical protein
MTQLQDHKGRSVRLTAERQAHIVSHPEMAGLESAMVETLRAPEQVIQSLSDQGAALHYRFFYGTRVGDKWLCVVVKYTALDAFVLTAYLTDKPKKGIRLWPNP